MTSWPVSRPGQLDHRSRSGSGGIFGPTAGRVFGHFTLFPGLLQNRLTWPGVAFLHVYDHLR